MFLQVVFNNSDNSNNYVIYPKQIFTIIHEDVTESGLTFAATFRLACISTVSDV